MGSIKHTFTFELWVRAMEEEEEEYRWRYYEEMNRREYDDIEELLASEYEEYERYYNSYGSSEEESD